MRKIINGKTYDTNTARMVADWANDALATDFDSVTEVLYRKKTGEYFIHGYGGAATRYAHQDALGGMAAGERIVPLSYQEAEQWAKEHADECDYEDEFGPAPEGDADGNVQVSFRMPEDMAAALDLAARRTGRTKQSIFNEGVERLLAELNN